MRELIIAGRTITVSHIETEATEFHDIYKLNVVEIPTNLPVKRQDDQDEFYKNEADKFAAIVKTVRKTVLRLLPRALRMRMTATSRKPKPK